MGGSNADDLDAMLDGLAVEDEQQAEGGAQPAPSAAPQSGVRATASAYRGRRHFDDLFTEDSAPIAHSPTGGPEEKVAYFREKMKRLETKVSRFKEAWAAREVELDALERIVARERQASEQNRQRARALDAFVAQKKAEMAAYSKRVAAAFTEKDAIEKSLREELDRIRATAEREREELRRTLGSFDQDLAERNEAITALKATIELQKHTVEARTRELKQAKIHAEESRAELLEGLRALNKEVATRDEKIQALRASTGSASHQTQDRDGLFAEASEAIASRDAKLAKYRRAFDRAKTEIHRLQFEAGSLRRELEEARRRRRSTGLGDGWEAVDAFTEVLEMSELAERVAERLELVAEEVLQSPKVRRADVREIVELAGRLRDAIDRIQRAADRR
jgi:chromosome segregation ATPase